eukprot:10988537-Ditylum_brightwellii.AAC.1
MIALCHSSTEGRSPKGKLGLVQDRRPFSNVCTVFQLHAGLDLNYIAPWASFMAQRTLAVVTTTSRILTASWRHYLLRLLGKQCTMVGKVMVMAEGDEVVSTKVETGLSVPPFPLEQGLFGILDGLV